MIDKQQVKAHFSKNASTYYQYANVQKRMGDVLIELLFEGGKDAHEVKNILEIGCGTGYLTSALTELFPSAHITAVDIAPGMISEIKHKFKGCSVDFICDDIEEMELDDTYDMIISNAAFQWFNHTSLTIRKLYDALNAGGTLCFSTFGMHTFRELTECFNEANEALAMKCPVSSGQSFYGLHELTHLCRNAVENETGNNEVMIQNRELFEYEYFDHCKDFFQSIKKIGASNSNKNGRNNSPAFIKKVMELYNKKFHVNNKVRASYHCLFFKIGYVGKC
ncbi:MAG: malonyl-ACP O-methyltransferase BioC [Clostridiaceae bacterium]